MAHCGLTEQRVPADEACHTLLMTLDQQPGVKPGVNFMVATENASEHAILPPLTHYFEWSAIDLHCVSHDVWTT